MHTLGRGRAFGEPGFGLVQIELDAIGMILRQQRIVVADALDEAAVARAARFGDDDGEMRALLGAAARKPDFQRHRVPFLFNPCAELCIYPPPKPPWAVCPRIKSGASSPRTEVGP